MKIIPFPKEGRWRSFSQALREEFGGKVHKVTLDAGFTCPNRDGTLARGGCIYCNNDGFRTPFHFKSLEEQLTLGMERIRKTQGADRFLAYFQAYTNTYGRSLEELESLYQIALCRKEVVALAIGTRPDTVPEPVLDLLERLARQRPIWIEYGLESAGNETLRRLHRGHTVEQFVDAVQRTQARDCFRICAHLIFGLPWQSKEERQESIRLVGALGIDDIKIHNIHVVRGTVLEKMYQNGEFVPMSLENYVQEVADSLERLPSRMVIQRLTGEAPSEVLVAPDWCRHKQKVVQAIHVELERRGTFQGVYFKARVSTM